MTEPGVPDETVVASPVQVPDATLELLRRKLDLVRWPERETCDGWQQGVPLARAQALVDHWRQRYDWRRCESLLNGLGPHRTSIDGLGIHFLHVRSTHEHALPLLITHGWPGSVLEFRKVIGPLTEPERHGGRREDAFHVVAPSLPGYGFSDRPVGTGWTVERIAAAWAVLMQRLGYGRWVAQGGDWGAAVTTALAVAKPRGLVAAHMNIVSARPRRLPEHPTDEESRALEAMQRYQRAESGYALEQATKPQTLGYALADSPVGQAMWIYEKFHGWMDCAGDPETVLSADEILDAVSMYWLTNAGASSARLYWESFFRTGRVTVDLPVGFSLFPKEIFRSPRHWAAESFSDIVHWREVERGGHFAALEQPEIFVRELRDCFRPFR
jgi:pimeloyl-ACP methyl ester carboxylesterase